MNPLHWKRNITRFLTAQTISLFGSSLVQYAIIWHLTITTSSGRILTLSTLCGFLPQIAISLFAGAWLDRYDRKKIILLADTGIAIATLVLALSLLAGQDSLWLLFGVLLVRSAGTGVQTPAVGAILPQIVPEGELMRIGGIHSTLGSATMFLAPAVSGAILSIAPLETALFIDVLTALVGVGITATIPIPPYQGAGVDGQENLRQIGAGFRHLRENPFVRRLLLYQLAVLFLISPSAFLTPLLVSRSFGAQVWYLTASEMGYSLGMVLGGILISTWGGFRNRMHTTLLTGGIYGLLMMGIGVAPVFLFYLCCNTAIGITSPCYNTPITVSIQERVEPAYHGRIFSLMQISTSCALPLGMSLFGPLADRVAVQLLLLICGGLVALFSLGAAVLGVFDRV